MSELDELLRFDVLRTELQALADEMAIRLMRSSFSAVIRDFLDFSTVLCDADGRVIAQGFALPLHLGAIPRAMEALRARFVEGLDPGDVVVLNDPYGGGMHLPDLFVMAPAHAAGRLVGYAVCVAHHADVGGRVPGGAAADSREIFEEGLRLPAVKLYAAGRVVADVERLIKANVRLPEVLWKDLSAQVASCRSGTEGLLELERRYGAQGFAEQCERLLSHSRRSLRAAVSSWPDGVYEYEDFEDNDGLSERIVPIHVRVTVRAGRISFDFAGTSPQVAGSINCTLSFTESACYAAVRALCPPDVPVNQGFFDDIIVHAEPGTLVHARFPAGVAARGVIGYRIIETIFGALAAALPDSVPAAGDGGTTGIRIGGFREDGTRFQFNDIVCGSWGARPGLDGLDGAAGIASNISNRPIESAEREDPVRIHAYGLVADSAGAGRFRGGLAVRRVVELLATEATLQLRSHRNRTRPYGLLGGEPGSLSATYLLRDGVRVQLPAKTTLRVRRGDVIEHVTASGGGIGPVSQRSADLIAADLADEKVTTTHHGVTNGSPLLREEAHES